MHELQGALRQLAQQANSDQQHLKLAIVTSVDPATGAVKATLQPEGVETGWMPYLTPLAGSGWGILAIPAVGTQVAVSFEQGHTEAGVVQGSVYDDNHLPPANYQPGEIWLVHQSGTLIKLTNDAALTVVAVGALTITAQAALSITAAADVTLNATGKVIASASEFDLTGPVKITGDLTVSGSGKVGGGALTAVKTVAGTSTSLQA